MAEDAREGRIGEDDFPLKICLKHTYRCVVDDVLMLLPRSLQRGFHRSPLGDHGGDDQVGESEDTDEGLQTEEVVHGRRGREWPDAAYSVSDSDCRYDKRCGCCATHPKSEGCPDSQRKDRVHI